MTISIFRFLLFSSLLSRALVGLGFQAEDSVQVDGEIKWTNPEIVGFPEELLIESKDDTDFRESTSVDSLGAFSVRLSSGKYIIQPARNYHWIGEEYLRIDDQKSKVEINVNSTVENTFVTIQLDTIPWPSIKLKKGLLHDFNSESGAKLDQIMEEYMSFFEIPETSIALVKEGRRIYHKAYGEKNALTREPVNDSTLFETGSVTKSVFAFVVMKLVEKEIIDLDRPIHKYLQFDDVSHDARYRTITARHVLSHRTGFPNWAKRNKEGQFDLKFDPGSQYGYSGEAYEYLKRTIESITGKEIFEILKEELLKPLGLGNTHFMGNEEVAMFSSNGHYNNVPSDIRLVKNPGMAYSLSADAKTFSNFLIALMNHELLSKDSYTEMFKAHSTRSDGVQWGLGFRIEQTSAGISYGHSGSTSRGFISNYCFFPDLNMGFVIFTNSHMGGWLSIPILTELLVTGSSAESRN